MMTAQTGRSKVSLRFYGLFCRIKTKTPAHNEQALKEGEEEK